MLIYCFLTHNLRSGQFDFFRNANDHIVAVKIAKIFINLIHVHIFNKNDLEHDRIWLPILSGNSKCNNFIMVHLSFW